jgi:peptidoglycan/xylan/chitin deacetylase (PgdA/CDA1 family)
MSVSALQTFMYHDIRDEPFYPYENRYNLSSFITMKKFKSHLDWIEKNYTVISEYIDMDWGNDSSAILTFDDGLKDHLEVAKELHSRGIRGTFFIPREPILSNKIVHAHKIQFVLACAERDSVIKSIYDILKIDHHTQRRLWKKYSVSNVVNNQWDEKMVFITNLLRNFNSNWMFNALGDMIGSDAKYKVVDELFDLYVGVDEKQFAQTFYLSESDIKEMISLGQIIGAHGNTSENLLHMHSQDIKIDIKKSVDYIRRLGFKNPYFSYPSGGYNNIIKEALKENNCSGGYTTVPKSITNIDKVDMMELPRYDGPNYIQT